MTTDTGAVLRVTSMDRALQIDATAVPVGPVRFAVVDQDERAYDLVLRARNDAHVLERFAPTGPDAGAERVLQLGVGDYVLEADGADTPRLHVEFVVQQEEPR